MLLPELGVGQPRWERRSPSRCRRARSTASTVNIRLRRERWTPIDTYLLVERPEVVSASAKSLARRHQELFVVDRVDHHAAPCTVFCRGDAARSRCRRCRQTCAGSRCRTRVAVWNRWRCLSAMVV